MLQELVAKFPKPADLLELTAPQMDAALLACIAARANDPNPIAAKFTYRDEISGLYPTGLSVASGDSAAVDAVLMASWERLKASGLIMQAPGQAPESITLTPRGREAARTTNMTEIMARSHLQRGMLHRALQKSVYDSFSAGHYDTAVRDAFVVVEDAVKIDSGIQGELGVKLMRSAFNPTGGPLTHMSLPIAERERMADLFAGAIGTFKNPHSHRVVGNTDPAPVIEELMLASRLMRFIRP